MATIGQILKEARERKGVSLSKASAETNIKLQHLEAMERDDFSRMAAPIYAKGFIRIYAEYLGLDPRPLIQQYTDLISAHAVAKEEPSRAAVGTEETEKQPAIVIDWQALRAKLKPAGLAVAAIVAVVLLGIGLRKWVLEFKVTTREETGARSIEQPHAERAALPILAEPPEPYIDALRAETP